MQQSFKMAEQHTHALREFARAGGRPVVLAYVAMLLSVIALFLVFFASKVDDSTSLCEYQSPREILTHVEGIEGPAVKVNGQVVERATRCVAGDRAITVMAYRTWRSADNSQPPITDLNRVQESRPPGNTSTDLSIQLPPGVKPGVWRLEGIDSVPSTGELRSWFSEDFRVVD